MKKTYIEPQLEVIQLKANQTLLAGSVNGQGEDKRGVSIFGDSDSNTYDGSSQDY